MTYEFTSEQEARFVRLTRLMIGAGFMEISFGLLLTVPALIAVFDAATAATLFQLFAGVVLTAIGGFTEAAASAFKKIAENRGFDIPNLMLGTDALSKLFTAQLILLGGGALSAIVILFLRIADLLT